MILGDAVVGWQHTDKYASTASGAKIAGDTIVWAENGLADTVFASELLHEHMDQSGSLLVQQTMQMLGRQHIFSGGHCVSI